MKVKVTFTSTSHRGPVIEEIEVSNPETSIIKDALNKIIRKDLDQRDYNYVKVIDILDVQILN